MNEIIVSREGNFAGTSNGFDLARDNKNFDERELLLAERVVKVLTDIFGNYMFKELFSGGVLVKDGTFQFMSRPWNRLYEIDRMIKAKFSKTNIGGHYSPTHVRHSYIIDRFTSSYDIELPTDGTVDVSKATISLSGIPEKFVLPIFKKPSDKSLQLDFYKIISGKIFEHFEALSHFKRETLERSWRSGFYKTLMRICRDRRYNSLQLSLADEGLRPRIFAQEELDFRNKAFNWLTSRGKGSVTFTFERGKGQLTLSPSDFRRYFKDDWAKFASSLYIPLIKGEKKLSVQIESDLRYMQDFIEETLAFIFDLAQSATNKKIILYPHTAFMNGYGVNLKNTYLPPRDITLNEWYFKINNPKQIGITLDLNDLNSVNNFVEMIPVLLGNLLVRPAAFIVRDPDHPYLDSDECTFAFDMSGSLLPSQMVGSSSYSSPPPTGMRWTGDSEADYRRSAFYLRWNEILARHNTLRIHKFNDPYKFYEIVRRVLFTNIDNVAFYL